MPQRKARFCALFLGACISLDCAGAALRYDDGRPLTTLHAG